MLMVMIRGRAVPTHDSSGYGRGSTGKEGANGDETKLPDWLMPIDCHTYRGLLQASSDH